MDRLIILASTPSRKETASDDDGGSPPPKRQKVFVDVMQVRLCVNHLVAEFQESPDKDKLQ